MTDEHENIVLTFEYDSDFKFEMLFDLDLNATTKSMTKFTVYSKKVTSGSVCQKFDCFSRGLWPVFGINMRSNGMRNKCWSEKLELLKLDKAVSKIFLTRTTY